MINAGYYINNVFVERLFFTKASFTGACVKVDPLMPYLTKNNTVSVSVRTFIKGVSNVIICLRKI